GVVRIDGDGPAVDLAEPCDHAVTGDLAVLHPEAVRAMRRKDVELDERALVEQHLDAIAGGRFARRPTLVRGVGVGVQSLVAALAVLVDLLFRNGGRLSLRSLDAFEARRGSAHWRKRPAFSRRPSADPTRSSRRPIS